jgi:hypothetical protein
MTKVILNFIYYLQKENNVLEKLLKLLFILKNDYKLNPFNPLTYIFFIVFLITYILIYILLFITTSLERIFKSN